MVKHFGNPFLAQTLKQPELNNYAFFDAEFSIGRGHTASDWSGAELSFATAPPYPM
jgi:hypothetical protein